MKERIKGIAIVTLIFLIILPLFSAFFNYLMYDINFNISLLKEVNFKQFISLNTYIAFLDYNNIFNAIGWIIIVGNIFMQIINNAEISKREKYQQNVKYGSHGTARFQTNKVMLKNYSKDKLGWFLGSPIKNETYSIGMNAFYHKINGKLNMQMTVVGPPATNKTTGFVLPNIFHLVNEYKNNKKLKGKEMPDLIITDPKSELFCLTSEYLEKQGYEVVVYDFIFLKYGNKFNSLEYINTEKELIEIASGYIHSVEGSIGNSGGENSFWNEQEGQALGALLGAVQQNFENATFYDALFLLTDKFTDKKTGALDIAKAKKYFDEKVKGAPLQLWKNFLLICESGNTSASILGGMAGKLKLFAIDSVRDIMSANTFDIRKLGCKIGDKGKEKPVAVFLFMPDSDRTFSPLINVTISTIFKQLYKTAYEYHNKLASPVYFIIEEMANIGKISNIQEMLGTMRGRRIYPMMIWQSLSQLKDRYKNGWEDILSMCDTQVYLGINDDFTAKYCSNALGNTTIQIQGISSKNKGFGVKDESESANYTQRKLMFPEELRSMSRDELILIQGGFNPSKLEKVQYKYWLDKYKLCNERTLSDLPLLRKDGEKQNDIKEVTINIDKNIEQAHERKKEFEQEQEIELQTEHDVEKEHENEKENQLSRNLENYIWNKRKRDIER